MTALSSTSLLPNLSLYKLKILLSYKLMRSWRMQFASELAHVTTGSPGRKANESMVPLRHYSNLYRIFLFCRSQRMTFPCSSPEVIQDCSLLKAKAVTGNFCLMEKTAWSLRRCRKEMAPLSKPTATISTKGEAYITVIFWSFYWDAFRKFWKEYSTLLEIAFTRTKSSSE
jgi:hypothetical protein